MATYQRPTEILPKFNEFVFNQANEPEYLDQLVVHKAGTETITGNKTITGTLTANNTTTSLTASVSNTISSARTTTGANVISATGAGGGNNITTASGRNLIEAGGGGVNLIQSIGGGTARNDIYSNGNASNANQLFAENGGNRIRASTDNIINAVSGSNRIQINGTDKIVVNSTDTAITNSTTTINGTTNINGYLTNTSAGGGGFTMVGSGSGGLYINYYPDGTLAGRKLYMGFPNTTLINFQIQNDYLNGSIDLGCNGSSSAINFNAVRIRKNNFEYPNIQVQWQTINSPSALNTYQTFTNNYFSNSNFSVGEAEYIKFPFDTTCNWIMISFEAAAFNGFVSRNLEIYFQSIAGAVYYIGETGAILGNADRAQYIQCNNQILPFNTELRPLFKYQGTFVAGTFYGKQFTATFNFTQR